MLALLVVGFRLANAVASRSFFQPDEYWQALEVAHRLVWNYGYQSWEWRAGLGQELSSGGGGGIRSPLYPMLFVPLLWLLKLARLDNTILLASPCTLQTLPRSLTFRPRSDAGAEAAARALCCSHRPRRPSAGLSATRETLRQCRSESRSGSVRPRR